MEGVVGGRQVTVGVDVKWTGEIEVKTGVVLGIGGLEGGKNGAGVDECAAVRIIEWPADVGGVKSVEGGV